MKTSINALYVLMEYIQKENLCLANIAFINIYIWERMKSEEESNSHVTL